MTTDATSEHNFKEYVTAMVAGQMFGLPILRVQDVFMPERLTRVPLASSEIAGVLNLRGRIVTVVDMRARLGLPKADEDRKSTRLNSSHSQISYAVFCLKKKKNEETRQSAHI